LPRSHDGFYLRLALGVGGASTSGAGAKYSGGSAVLGAAFGGAFSQHLIFYGEFVLLGMSSPSGKNKAGNPSLAGNPVDHIGIGPGVAYYFMPLNLYLSGSLLFQKMLMTKSSDAGSEMQFTSTGLGLSFMVGKEWWISGDWGVGAAGQVLLTSAKDRDGTQWGSGALSIMFTATYN
jgi:hypothetical protein